MVRMMVCGHWSWSYVWERMSKLNGRTREMEMFGPGCHQCHMHGPDPKSALKWATEDEPLFDPTKDDSSAEKGSEVIK